mmetsp:Transcript_6711/g.11917  ORF Transcript_6711/g.11917 Transcript_6711/m.11917 type:complete len:797 (-) Transcript_6711:377-2767(-)|eukprot:CAMPEP_0204915596 /NCGR_PEP_ID=MMETSP1397-20131031/13559_1 /ASSEMBLY_ACC=CAM_ASM_000891 /TAXON_ID=49980 /ORGANISM="Climacostomum Climacostomum virens, Strain Stock W-24" /LENGTH=796 /DNA_ID=CAMNT_0052087705 /DNA_START=8 /DNA_END=2398 /DNA_ORIENTATION=-
MLKTRVTPVQQQFEMHEVEPAQNLTKRTKIRDFIDGKYVTILMSFITIWVLFGENIRLLAASKSEDEGFFASYMVCLVLFLLELILFSLFMEEYKFSFFFWLDLVATLSLIPDIPYILDPMIVVFQGEASDVDVDIDDKVNRNNIGSAYAARFVKGITFIRLVRIVKLYKYFTKGKESNSAKKARKKEEDMDARNLGKKLSDVTTRRVIIGVLLMLVFIPLLQSVTFDNTRYYGLQQLFWMGRSACTHGDELGCNNSRSRWINEEGWKDFVYRYSQCNAQIEGGSERYPLLWLRAPDFTNKGKIGDITSVESQGKSWEEESDCSGKTVPSDCYLRDEEMELVIYLPEDCEDEDPEGCEELKAYARFDVKGTVESTALMDIFITIFVGFILAAASVLFAKDVQTVVIKPVTKMVTIIKNLAEDPLSLKDEIETRAPSRDSILEETIGKIGGLLQMGYGELGSSIIQDFMSEDGNLDLMKAGSSSQLILGVVWLRAFTDVTECLKEDVMVFLNKIAKIVHTCCQEWGGHVCKNGLGKFLLIWQLNQHTPNQALFAMIKIIAEMQRAHDIKTYKTNQNIAKNPRILAHPDKVEHVVSLGIGLHIGWAVKGAIGTEAKVDVGYLSPHIDFTNTLALTTENFRTQLLMSESFFETLHERAATQCRRIDTVKSSILDLPFGLYTYDMPDEVGQAPEKHRLGAGIPLNEADPPELLKRVNPSELFVRDMDIVMIQRSLIPEFVERFSKGYEAYIKGEWEQAYTHLKRCYELRPLDGPNNSLLKVIQESNCTAPEGWAGYRELV